ncbi:MAG: phenylalanine--tRNA ligase subunit beta [Thermomicrobia bacterium]|nr:phenylalanine--tRNA ligase subunit beta [Thermomicrobia bacterium]
MKVSWRWLREYVDLGDITPRELARRLTMAGLEAEKIEEIGAAWDRDLVRVARVKDVRRIEGADRVVQVFLELPERDVMVVTGAPNIRAGQKIALALIGARLYDGHRDDNVLRTLKPRAIMGITGEGMVCSEKELGISDEHEGILVLPDDAPSGAPLADYLGDTVIEFEITPNLVHDFSIVGVAREAAAVLGTAFRDPFPRWAAEPLDAPAMPGLITVEDTALCPRYTALVVEGITVAPSPDWMQRRLLAVGVRPVNNIVDISNYVMLEYGQPNHTFDLDRVVGRRLIVRHALPGETMELINHETKTLTPAMAAVCDEAGVTDLGGIIGGTRSEIVDATTTVLIEAANWEMRNIRHTRQALNIRTDASARYERGLEPELTMPSARRAAELIMELCPAARIVGYTDIYPDPPPPRSLMMRFSTIAAVLGIAYPLDAVRDALTRLQFGVAVSDDADPELTIAIPPHRADVSRPEDIVEEVARIIGYETIPATMIAGTTPHVIRSDRWIAREAARDAVASAGLIEVSTYSFTSAEALDRLAVAGGPGAAVPILRLVNPLGEWEGMRPTLRASLLATASDNLKFVSGVAIGEVANVYLPRDAGALPDERLTLGIVLAGRDGERLLGIVPRAYDFFDLKGMIEAILPPLGVGSLSFTPADDPVFQPGRGARVAADGQQLGVIGEVHPRVVAAFGMTGRVMLAELDLEPIVASVAARRGVLRRLPVTSRYPATENDFAVVVDESVAAAEVAQVLAQAVGALGQRVQLFDVYRGDQVPAGKKSLTFAVTMQAPDRVLSESEVTKVRDRVRQALAKRLKATLRS